MSLGGNFRGTLDEIPKAGEAMRANKTATFDPSIRRLDGHGHKFQVVPELNSSSPIPCSSAFIFHRSRRTDGPRIGRADTSMRIRSAMSKSLCHPYRVGPIHTRSGASRWK